MARVLRRALRIAGVALGGAVLLLGGEAIYALTREYPLTDPEQPVRGEFGDPARPRLRFVVLGDSTSVGVGTTPEQSFPWRLATRLGERFSVRLDVVGFGGATTSDVARVQVDRALALDPGLILVEVGANDTTHLVPLPAVRSNTARILDRLASSGAEVVVVGPPHMGTSPVMPEPLRTLSGWRGAAVGRRIEEEARARGIRFVELAPHTEGPFRRDPERYYSSDWFHPGPAGYRLWADVMYPAVLEAAEAAVSRDAPPADRAPG